MEEGCGFVHSAVRRDATCCSILDLRAGFVVGWAGICWGTCWNEFLLISEESAQAGLSAARVFTDIVKAMLGGAERVEVVLIPRPLSGGDIAGDLAIAFFELMVEDFKGLHKDMPFARAEGGADGWLSSR